MSANKASTGARLSTFSKAVVLLKREEKRRSTIDKSQIGPLVGAGEDASLTSMVDMEGEDAERAVTITKAKLQAIQKALTERVKAQCNEMAAQEAGILEMEIQDLRETSDVLQAENRELKATLDEVMLTFEALIVENDKNVNQSKASIGLLEMDLAQARSIAEEKSEAHKTLFTEYTHMKSTWDQMINAESSHKKKITEMEGRLQDSQGKFEALKSHADSKLKAAGSQFIMVQKEATAKADELHRMREEIAVLQTRHTSSEAMMNELKAANHTMSQQMAKAQEVQKQNHELSHALATKTNDFNELKMASIAATDQAAQSQGQVADLQAAVHGLTEDNARWKKLYEASQSSAGGDRDGGSTKMRRLENDVFILEEALDKKEKENADIVMICEELMKEVEQLKAGRR